MTSQEWKEFNQSLRTPINKHLNENDNSIKISLSKTDSIVIRDIIFDIKPISLNDGKCSFTLCTRGKLQIKIENIKEITFQNCEFKYEPILKSGSIWFIKFIDCNFENIDSIQENILKITNPNKKVYFENCCFNKLKFGDIRHIRFNTNVKLCYFEFVEECYIKEFIIENIEIASKFYINKQYDGNDKKCKIDKLVIHHSIFKENFKLHNCEIDEAEIKDTDFKNNADFYKNHFKSGLKYKDTSQLEEIYFKALNFHELALFGDTKFDKKFHLKYVTLKGFSHFRNAEFHEGLDLDYTNTQNTMNFFGIKELDNYISKSNTSQETYRIIKYNLEALENIVEANKYHVLELEKHREDIWSKDFITIKLLLDGIVSFLHRLSSNHSSNWFLALFWIIMVSIGTNLFLDNDILSIECILKYVNILSKLEDFENSYTIMTFNKILLGYLYYQFLTAVRKDTRKK
jgi:hypothetical protein